MEEVADIYYVDTRNADVRDHRAVPSLFSRPAWASGPLQPTRPVYASSPTRPVVYSTPTPVYTPAPVYGTPGPVVYAAPGQLPVTSILGKLTAGQLITMAAKAVAAFQSLPSAPKPTDSVGIDVANLTVFQEELAKHAQLVHRLSVAGELAGQLLQMAV